MDGLSCVYSAARRRLNRVGILKSVNDTPPLHFGLLEIDQQTQRPARGSEVVNTLRGVIAGQALDTFQLDDQHILDENIGEYSPTGWPL